MISMCKGNGWLCSVVLPTKVQGLNKKAWNVTVINKEEGIGD